MRSEKDIREALVKSLKTRGEQGRIANCLDVHSSTVKRWSEGEMIPPAMQKLLAWYLFGEVPPSLVQPGNLQGTLDFDVAEWKIIGILAKREGVTEAQWIAGRIRAYLAYTQNTAPPAQTKSSA